MHQMIFKLITLLYCLFVLELTHHIVNAALCQCAKNDKAQVEWCCNYVGGSMESSGYCYWREIHFKISDYMYCCDINGGGRTYCSGDP
ncbi:unnamed protein product [Cunninghamella blakesleeana]